nr:DNA repair/transcription protein MET18/MMS19 [Halisarca dujardinii]
MEDSRIQSYISGHADGLPEDLAQEIKSNSSSLLNIVEELGPYLTSSQDETRARATRLLSSVLHSIRSFSLSENEVNHLVLFYCDRLKDRPLVLPQVFYGLETIISYPAFSGGSAVKVCQALFKEIHLQAHSQGDRHRVYQLLGHLLSRHTPDLRTLNNDFVFGYIKLMEGEKDPRNLLIVFQTVLAIIERLPFDLFVEDLFEVTACYFPIDFNPPPNDPYGVTREELILGLRSVLASTPRFAEFCIPLLLEKLSSDITSAKLDSLQTLAMCAPVYGLDGLKTFLVPIWSELRSEVMQVGEEEVEEAALVAMAAVTRGLVAVGENQTNERGPLNEFIDLVVRDCSRCMCESSDVDPPAPVMTAARALRAAGSAGDQSLELVLSGALPLVLKRFSSKEVPSQRAALLDSTSQLLGGVVDHCDRGGTVPGYLATSKEVLVEMVLGSLHSSASALRRSAVCSVAVLVALPRYLDQQELVHCALKLTDLALSREEEDHVRRESAHALAVMSRACPSVVTETVLPFLLKTMGCSERKCCIGTDIDTDINIVDDAMETDSPGEPNVLSKKDLPIIHLLTALSVHREVCDVTLPSLTTCLEHLSVRGRTLSSAEGECSNIAGDDAPSLTKGKCLEESKGKIPSLNGECSERTERKPLSLAEKECQSLAKEISKQVVNIVEANRSDGFVMKTVTSVLARVSRACVGESLCCSSSEQCCVLLTEDCLLALAALFRIHTQSASSSDSSRQTSKLVHLLLEGDLSVVDLQGEGEGEGESSSTGKRFAPLSANSPDCQTRLVALMMEGFCSQDYQVLSPHYQTLLPRLLNLAVECRNHLAQLCAAKTYAALINKVPSDQALTDLATPIVVSLTTMLQGAGSGVDRDRITVVLLWLCRSLVVRSHSLGQSTIVKVLQSEDVVVLESLAKHFGVLLEDTSDLLSKDCRAVTKFMYKQRFFQQVLPVVVRLLNGQQEGVKPFCFQVLVHLFKHVPRQVLLEEMNNLLPLLVQSLSCSDSQLKVSSLESLLLLIEDTPTSISSYVPTLVPILLDLAKSSDALRVRIPALQCLSAMTSLPPHTVYPYQQGIIKALQLCLDDKKRLVRKEASTARSRWFLLGAV